MQKFYNYIRSIRPYINAKAIEQAAEVPAQTLARHYRWVDGKDDARKIPDAHVLDILAAIAETIGTPVIDGWRINARPLDGWVLMEKPVSDTGLYQQVEPDDGVIQLLPHKVWMIEEQEFFEWLAGD